MTNLREKFGKIAAKMATRARYVILRTAEIAAPGDLFQEIVRLITQLRAPS
ncbi:MAG: hypothetical protein ACHQRJ_01855 [Alphaproteobacteria bacterium]